MKIAFYTVESILYLICLICVSEKIFNVKTVNKKALFIITFMYEFLITVGYTLHFNVFLCVFLGVQIIQILTISKKSTFKKLVSAYIFIYSISMILSTTFDCIFVLSVFNFLILDIIINILIFTSFAFICFNKKMCLRVQKILISIPKSIKALTIASFLVSSVLTNLILINPILSVNTPWNIMVRVSLVLLLLFVCTTFPILIIVTLTNSYLKIQNRNFQKDIEAQAKHYSDIAKSNYELRRFKHDFNNLKIGLKSTLNDNNCEAALSIIENSNYEIQNTIDKINNFDTGNGIVDAILSDKQITASKINTIISFSGSVPPSTLSPTDLCVIFGNTLDNAIEACEKISHETEKHIFVSCKCNSGFIFISITNPVAENILINDNRIDSSKHDKASHGYGLYSLTKIVKKLDGSLNLSCKNKTFTVEIDLTLVSNYM